MSAQGWLQIVFYLAVLTALTPLLGAYMARVYTGQPLLLERVLGPLERLVYRLLGPAARTEQDWKAYAKTTVVFSAVFFVVLYVVLRTQGIQPFNPEGFDSGTWDVSFNTTASFISNTNWQYYGGETTLSYFSQMVGLTVQNFVSAAVGMAVLAAVIRGFASRGSAELGNFWRDVTRTLLYILLPISFVGALILVSQGVIQTLSGSIEFPTVTGVEQSLALGPAASQVSIKQLGTNGGGFFNVNSTYPFENPTQFSNFVEMLFILLIPAGLTATFGRMVGNRRQGWSIYAAMLIMLAVTIGVGYAAESNGSPAQQEAGIEVDAGATDVNVEDGDQQVGGNLEGKENRNGLSASTTWAAATTAASNGSVNSALDSYTGIGGLAPMFNMLTGEVIFGGVGSGLYGMLMFVLLAVFIAGLMVGRTPEYLGKKIEAREVKLVMVGTIVVPLIVLIGAGIAIASKYGDPSIYNPGPQGFSETLYAYGSQSNNNGSAFAGYTGFVQPNAPGNVGAYGITLRRPAGRSGDAVRPLRAVAGGSRRRRLAGRKRVSPPGPGTFRTDTPTFVLLLIMVVVLVAALTFFPAALLGPIVQGLTDSLAFPK